jgi:ferredoxin-like protein FixX
LLAGNAGSAMWNAFCATGPGSDTRNPLDSWLNPQILAAADAASCHVVLPNEGPPYVPIQDWAKRADPIHRSPTGIMIHPEFGLWHVYRAAFLFAERIEIAPPAQNPSPCDSCAAKPCLNVCPVDAFKPDWFDVKSCADHVAGVSGTACLEGGCMARRACPVGRQFTYPRDAQEFHTAAFLRAAERF